MRIEQVGLQLYTVREAAARDFTGTLRRVAQIGYRAVELAGYGGLAVPALRATLDGLGLRAMGAHVAYTQFETRIDEVCAELRALGCDYAIVPSLPPALRGHAAGARQAAANFNRWGAACRDAGLRFGYHNHAFEFAPLADGRTLYDTLVAETDPALVGMEVDCFWVAYGGASPVAVMRRLAGRLPIVHMKDLEPGPARADAPVGAGLLPYKQWIAIGEAAGAEWFIVEQDHPKNALEDVATSFRNLQAMAGES